MMGDDASAERFSLKDHLFNRESVTRLANMLASADPEFPTAKFIEGVMDGLSPLELKQRVSFITEVLASYLPRDFDESVAIVVAALPAPLDPTLADGDFGDFTIASLGEFVSTRGLESFELSMAAIKEITKRFSMEGPLRPFIDSYPGETLAVLTEWATDENYHVRRLVSEGTRPLLPWAPRIGLEPSDTIPLLDLLHADPTRYVTRSVANHLNDIAKSRPELVIDTLGRWRGAAVQDEAELQWMTRHALRTLIKKGQPNAMQMLGYSPQPAVSVGPISLGPGPVRIGGLLQFEVPITAHSDEKLMVDYVIDFVKKDGSTRPKVFKMKQLAIAGGETNVLGKSHRMPANATTFTLYPGTHRLSLQVNGSSLASTEFLLEP
jgi:3-methyladenine DNA glycosylase AlkC